MYDFPNAPVNGQQVTTPNGAVFTWDGVKWTATASGGSATASGDTGRNLIINPMFNISQRGAGPFTTYGYGLDRWIMNGSLDTISITQAAIADAGRMQIGDEEAGLAISNNFTGNAGAAAQSRLQQPIENVRRLAGKTVTVSFWAAAAAGAPKLGINMIQAFGTGGSPSANVTALATGASVTLSTTWGRYSASITLPTIVGKTLGTNNDHYTSLLIAFSSGATNNAANGNVGVQTATINLWGVQVEIGSVMTPFEKPDPEQDWSRCQRYYCNGQIVFSGYAVAATAAAVPYGLPVTMRAAPTLNIGSFASSVNVTSVAIAAVSLPAANRDLYGSANVTATGSYTINFTFTAFAEL